MNRIRLLSDQVANQIAAGEVVERPASVVKELVENSLDAGANRIAVEIQAGGRSLMRVTDDGTGMSRDDALLCLERHATSKIRLAEDLANVGTMGFRGEALPSIASVSRFTLTTREKDSETPEGTQVIINGGKILEVKAAGSAPGTTIEVRQLFFNLPARRKFLRTEETEFAHIQHYLTLAALAYPEVGFVFQKDGRLIWQLPAIKSGLEISVRLPALRERLRALYGDDQKLLPVDFVVELERLNEVEEPGKSIHGPAINGMAALRVWGFIGAPGISRSTREDQHLFVNRRPIENRGLNFALLEGYHTALMKGRYPVCCLFLELDPAAVDVNIHPSKREVKFHREQEIRRLVAQAVRERLLQYHSGDNLSNPSRQATVQSKNFRPAQAPTEALQHELQTTLPNLAARLAPTSSRETSIPAQRSLPIGFGHSAEGRVVPSNPPLSTVANVSAPAELPDSAESQKITHPIPTNEVEGAKRQLPVSVPLLQVPLRLVGVIGKLYVVLESDRGLVLLDQHAAHERILFEQMLTRLEQNQQAASQRLLLPETVELSVRDANFLRQQLEVLARLGVGLSEFGERTFLLDALPPFVKVPDARHFVLELVDELKAAGQQVNSLRLGEHTVAKTVCRHAVKANDPLGGPELENLVEDLRHCAMPYTCPHGRPTLIEMNYRELEKKFGRSQ